MQGKSEFDIFKAKKRFPDPEKACVLSENAISGTFRFNTQVLHESGKRFFSSKISNSDSPHVFTLEESFPEKICKFHVCGPTPIV